MTDPRDAVIDELVKALAYTNESIRGLAADDRYYALHSLGNSEAALATAAKLKEQNHE